jgi:RNA recognition motif-containing protein
LIHQHPEADETPSRILWVGNISNEVSENDLENEFGQFGKIESLRILHNRYCAFINFEEEEPAKRAKQSLNGAILGGQYIVVNFRKVNSIYSHTTLLIDFHLFFSLI